MNMSEAGTPRAVTPPRRNNQDVPVFQMSHYTDWNVLHWDVKKISGITILVERCPTSGHLGRPLLRGAATGMS